MDDSEDDWSLHDIDRAPEPVGDAVSSSISPMFTRPTLSSRRGSGGFVMEDTSASSLRYNAEGRGGGVGRRFQRRAWGSNTGVDGPPSTAAGPNNTPPSINLEAVMSFPPMSEDRIALSNHAERQRTWSNGSSFSWGEQRASSPRSNVGTAAHYLHNQGSLTGNSLGHNSLTGMGGFGFVVDESISEHLGADGKDEDGDEEDDDISLSNGPPMPVTRQRSKSSFRNPRNQQSVTSGLTPQQRARFEEGNSSRPRLHTEGSTSTRSRAYIQGPLVAEKQLETSENSRAERPPEARRHLGSVEIASDSSWIDDTEHGGEEDETEGGDSTTIETKKAILLWGGIELPYWLISWIPSLHRVSTLVVTRSPCFICWGFRQPTDRTILTRLNILVSCVTALQIAAAVFLASVSWNKPDENAIDNLTADEQSKQSDQSAVRFNVWTTNVYILFTGMLAFINFTAAFLTIRVIRNVNLVGAIRYLWVLLWILPLQFQSTIGLFDYFRVTDVWTKHYWRDASMSWFRERFCEPSSTADFECTVPFSDNATETEWCLNNFNATNCASIRNSAQNDMETWILGFYYVNASIGLTLICLVVLTVNVLEHIISKPLVQKSRESNVPAWMSLPIVSCVAFGLVFSFSETSVLNTRTESEATWIGPLFLTTAGLYFLAAMIGWYISAKPVMSTRHKRNKLIFIWAFMVLMVCIMVLLTTIFATCIAFSVSLVDVPISESQRGNIACFLEGSRSCTRCDEETNRCPEWSKEDVTKVIRTQAKASASLAAMLMLYAFSALRFGIGLRTHIRMYQIEYM